MLYVAWVQYHPAADAEASSEIAAAASTGVVVVSEGEKEVQRDRTAIHVWWGEKAKREQSLILGRSQ